MFGLIDIVMAIQEFMTYFSVATNCAILFFTYPNFGEYAFGLMPGTSTTTKLWVIIIIEHVLILSKSFLAQCIRDAPAWVVDERYARRHKATRDAQYLLAEALKNSGRKKKRIEALNREVVALKTQLARAEAKGVQSSPSRRRSPRGSAATEPGVSQDTAGDRNAGEDNDNNDKEREVVAVGQQPTAQPHPTIRDERAITAAKERPIGGTGTYDLSVIGTGTNEWDEYGGDEYDGAWGRAEDGDEHDADKEEDEEGEDGEHDSPETKKSSDGKRSAVQSDSDSDSSDEWSMAVHRRRARVEATAAVQEAVTKQSVRPAATETSAQRAQRHIEQAKAARRNAALSNSPMASSAYSVPGGKDHFVDQHISHMMNRVLPPIQRPLTGGAVQPQPPRVSTTAGRDAIADILAKSKKRRSRRRAPRVAGCPPPSM